MTTTRRAGYIGGALGLGALVALTPSFVSGNARNTVGSGTAQTTINRPLVAHLTGAAEVPGPGDTDGSGAASITIDVATGEICFDLRAVQIETAAAAHIHEGAAGTSGPVVVNLTPPAPFTSAGCVTATPALAADIIETPADYYVNVHNATFTAGAIRGQLAASATTSGMTQVLAQPVRAYDSRLDTAQGPLKANTTRVVSLATGLDSAGQMAIAVPPGATAAIVKLTVTDAVGAGFLKIYSNALAAAPATASVNWYQTGAIIGETGPVPVDALGLVKVTSGVNDTHFVIDVVGFIY